jgi:N-hydroxyarylamine O-acetyltransferase
MSATGWEVHRLDLDAYLGRIGYTGSLDRTEQTLKALHRAHVAAIPFENLDVILGRGVDIDLDRIVDKLVRCRRGGYCYEHGLLFAAALERLGYRLTRILARTGDPAQDPRPRSHLLSVVELDGQRWLADVGFGSGLLEPVPLVSGGTYPQGDWTYRVTRGDDGYWRLADRRGSGWVTIISIAEEWTYPVDVAVANHHTSTAPTSPFVQRPIVVRKDEHVVRGLDGRRFGVSDPRRTVEERAVTDEEYGEVLSELGIPLPSAEVRRLIAALPATVS